MILSLDMFRFVFRLSPNTFAAHNPGYFLTRFLLRRLQLKANTPQLSTGLNRILDTYEVGKGERWVVAYFLLLVKLIYRSHQSHPLLRLRLH